MLYRLTHISEGSDYSWATALEDFASDVGDLREFRTSGWSLPFAPENFASVLKNWFDQDGPFTREVTADVMYLMLSFNAGPGKESLGDILASECGMSDILLYDHYVRRTAYDMRGATTLTLENFTGDGKTVTLSIQNGKLVVDDSRKGDMSVDLPSGSVSARSPITLPRETFPSALRYRDRFLAGYNEKFTVTYADGEWSVSKWDEENYAPTTPTSMSTAATITGRPSAGRTGGRRSPPRSRLWPISSPPGRRPSWRRRTPCVSGSPPTFITTMWTSRLISTISRIRAPPPCWSAAPPSATATPP